MSPKDERLFLNFKKMPEFLASRREEFSLGPETRLDHSEFLCNKVLLKYKGDKAFNIDIRRWVERDLIASISSGVINSPMNKKDVWRL